MRVRAKQTLFYGGFLVQQGEHCTLLNPEAEFNERLHERVSDSVPDDIEAKKASAARDPNRPGGKTMRGVDQFKAPKPSPAPVTDAVKMDDGPENPLDV